MLVLAIPISGLYFAAVGITLRHDRQVAKRAAAQEAKDALAGL